MGVNLKPALPAILKARGLSQEWLAEETGIRRTDINALCRGRIEAGPSRLQRIADALDVSFAELGAPAEEATDPRSQSIHSRLEELEAALEELRPILRLGGDLQEQLDGLARRVASLEQRHPQGTKTRKSR